MENDEFEHQLSLEKKEKAFKEQQEKENPYLTRDPNDGTLYEWDVEKKAWFPKIDDTFLAFYHNYNYQYVEPENDKNTSKKKKEDDKKFKKPDPVIKKDNNEDNEDNQQQATTSKNINKVKKQPEWFEVDEDHNTSVYVSNLPEDTTETEFIELMQKCGFILKDDETKKIKIKLYRTKDGNLKGDGLCTYIKPESVILALQILDGYQFNGKIIKVERAKFELKGDYNPSLKPRKRKPEDRKKQKKKLARLFDWHEKEPAERSKREKVVIIKNFFDPKEFDTDPTLIVEYKKDLEEECSEKCGEVKKIEIYDRNVEGVVAIFFKEFEHADQCVSLMNGRFFAGRQLSAENWDGKTKYKIQETEEEEKRRLEEWRKYLEEDDDNE